MGKAELDLFGVTSDEVEKGKDILPSLDLKSVLVDLSPVEVIFRENMPKIVEIPDEDEPSGVRKASCIVVEFGGTNNTLWLGAKSLAMAIARIAQDNAFKLEGVKARITMQEGTHAKYGKVNYYNAQQVKDEE